MIKQSKITTEIWKKSSHLFQSPMFIIHVANIISFFSQFHKIWKQNQYGDEFTIQAAVCAHRH
jgi:hypothetical protein